MEAYVLFIISVIGLILIVSNKTKSDPSTGRTITGAVVICQKHSATGPIEKIVYNEGNGPYVLGYNGDIFYLMNGGGIEGDPTCGGDPRSWREHIGEVCF